MLLFATVAALACSSVSRNAVRESEEEMVDGGLDDLDVTGLGDVESLLSFEAGLNERLGLVAKSKGRQFGFETGDELKGLASVGLGVDCLIVPNCAMAAKLDGAGATVISRRPPLASDKIRKLKNLQFIVTEDVEATNELLDAPVTYNRVSASRARYLAKKHGGSGHSVEQRLLVPFDAAHLSLIERPLPRVVGVIVDDIRQTEEAVEFAKKYRSTHPQHVFRLVLPIEAYEDEDSWMRYYSEEEDELLDVIFVLHERSLY